MAIAFHPMQTLPTPACFNHSYEVTMRRLMRLWRRNKKHLTRNHQIPSVAQFDRLATVVRIRLEGRTVANARYARTVQA